VYKHILLPTDGSEAALRALRSGVELALKIGARATVMTALEHFPTGIMGSGYRPMADSEDESGLQLALERLGAAEQILLKSGVSYQSKLVRNKPVYVAIVDTAKECGADLIVMGTHGMGLMERLFIGSQTQRVLAHTTIPVLTLH
jgi:nucleotide-binding universal stress UspA family protein